MSKLKSEDVQKFIDGDDSLFPKIFIKYRNKINYLAIEILHNEADCEEVVQNTFIKVIARRNELRDANAFNSWIYRIAYNTSLDLYRKNKRGTSSASELDIENHFDKKGETNEVLRKKEILEAIQNQIDELPEEARQLAILRFVGECSIEEIAEIMNIPEGTVKSRLHRVKRKLKEGLSLKKVTPATYLSFMFTPLTIKLYNSLVRYHSINNNSEAKIMKTIENATGVTTGVVAVGASWTLASSFGIATAVTSLMVGGLGVYSAFNPIDITPKSVEAAVIDEITYLDKVTNQNLQVVLIFNGKPEETAIKVALDGKEIAVEASDDEKYSFIATKNGEYKVDYLGAEKTVTIANIDKEGPVLLALEKADGLLRINGSDNHSGIDFEKSYVMEDDNKIELVQADMNSGYFKDAVKKKAKLRLYDKSGNYQTYEILASEISKN